MITIMSKRIYVEKPVTDMRPSWAGKPEKFTDLLLSDKPWKFDEEEIARVEDERNQDHYQDNLI